MTWLSPFLLHQLRHRLAWALTGILGLWLVGWLALPPLLKSQLETRLTALLGRQVTVKQVDFQPWSLALTLHNFSVAKLQPGGSSQLSIERIYVDVELQSLLRLAPVVDAIAVDAPQLHLTHLGDGHYDVDDVLLKLIKPADTPWSGDTEPLRFALYNLSLSSGSVEFLDAPKGQTHHLSQLQISVPFLSNLDSKRDVLTQPKLAFDLNGSRFESSGTTTPFAQSRKAEAQFLVKRLDIKPYLSYWPASLPVRLTAAAIDVDVNLAFEQSASTSVTLSGFLAASGVTAEFNGAELLTFERLAIGLKAVQPLRQDVQLGQIEWTRPRLMLHRNRAGMTNLLAALQGGASVQNDSKKIASQIDSKRAKGLKEINSTQRAPAAWQFGVDSFVLQGGELQWHDEATVRPVQLSLTDLSLKAQSLSWPVRLPIPFNGTARLASARLDFKGNATDQNLLANLNLADFPLSLSAPYAAKFLTPTLKGQAGAELGFNWAAAQAGQPVQMGLQVPRLTIDQVVLVADKKPALASVRQILVRDGAVDLTKKTITLGVLQVVQPKTNLTRSADARWMFQDWLNDPQVESEKAHAATNTVAHSDPAAGASETAWQFTVNDFQVSRGALHFEDMATPEPVALDATDVALQVKRFSMGGTAPFDWTLVAQLRHSNTEPCTLSWRGTSSLSPLMLRGALAAQRLPLHALAPYASEVLNASLQRADTSFKVQVKLAQHPNGLALQLSGDAALEDLQLQTLPQPTQPAEDLLHWKSLNLTGLDIALAPNAATRVDVQGTVLSDFYAKLVLNEVGRLNLQDVLKPAAPADPALPRPVQAPTARVHLGPISLLGGSVNFTDRFIRPNYSADLTELTGKLSALSSEVVQGEVTLADLELHGRAQGTASLEVLGKINPLVKPLALDIQAKVRELELAPLSTYSARYVGYGIERGKLSVDLAYKVQADGQLSANNKIVLNQLKFGDAVPNPVNSLPVKLAVALLADRNGVIDIDLPISGSLNDPQFRLLPLVFKIIGNLIVKAITAPFSLLASAMGGGGDSLSTVSFDAGSAVLSAQAKASLEKVAKALQDRPALKMTVVGTASLQAERDAYKRAQLQALLQIEKRRVLSNAAADAARPLGITPQEYPALLKAVYKRGDFPKPRNLIGLTKDISVPEMEALLLAHLQATEPAIQALAVQRGVAVRDYLASLKLPTQRLFLGAAKAVAPDAQWQPRAELNLALE